MASSDRSGPLAAGPAIVRAIELAAGLAELTAEACGRDDLVERARVIAAEAAPLAAEDAAAYEDFLRTRSEEARARTIELPRRMEALALQAQALTTEAAGAARGAVRGDAEVGVLLAETAARAAALLVEFNDERGSAG